MNMSENVLPTVAIVGRQNVGKSTLFNRFINRRKAIVRSELGTTRDRIYETVEWQGRQFRIVDTGGHQLEPSEYLSERVNQEVKRALTEADLVLFVVENEGISSEDHHLADIVKSSGKPFLYVVNKVDNENDVDLNEVYGLGFPDPIMISALHGLAINDLLDRIVELIPVVSGHCPPPVDFNLSIIGEPNVGKSTLLNRILDEERSIVSAIPGTTRDSVEEVIEHKGLRIRLIDTAGIKRKRKINDPTDIFSLSRAKESIGRADVIFVLFDAEKGTPRDTRALFEFIQEWKKTALIVVNKWDLVKGIEMFRYERDFKDLNAFLRFIPVTFISALTGRNVETLLDMAVTLWQRHAIEVKTTVLNEFAQALNKQGKLPSHLKVKYMTQVGKTPPVFMIFVNNKKIVTENHYNYIINELIETFGLHGVQIELVIKDNKETKS
jgi:GTPase